MVVGNIKKVAEVIISEYKEKGTQMKVDFRENDPLGYWFGAKARDVGFDSVNPPIIIGYYGGGAYSIVDLWADGEEFWSADIITAIKNSIEAVDKYDENTEYLVAVDDEDEKEGE